MMMFFKRAIRRPLLAAVASLICAAALFCVASAADSGAGTTGVLTLKSVDGGLLSANLTELIDRFASSDQWKAVDGTTAVGLAGSLAEPPYSPLVGDHCLALTAPAGRSGAAVRREYAYPLNLAAAKWLCFCVSPPDGAGRSFAASITVTFIDGTVYDVSAPVSGGVWTAVICRLDSISPVSGGGLVTTIELSLTSADSAGFTAHFDALGISSSPGFYSAMTCLADKWYASGGILEQSGDGSLSFEVSETDPFIETTALRYNSFTAADALRLRIINGAGCKSLTFYYTTYTSPDFSAERSRTVEIQAASSAQTVYLPVTSDYVGQIRIVFNGELRGDIKILSIMPVSTYVSYDNGYASLNSCRLTSSETIRLEGALTDAALGKLRGSALELYELECWQKADAATLSALEPVDGTAAIQSFAFEFSLYRGDGTSRVNSKFALVSWRDGVPLLLDGYKYITNPEYLAPVETKPVRAALIKGASPAETAGSLTVNGTAQTVLEVSLPELMTLTGSGVTFTSGGVVYAAANSYVESLDETVRRCTESGIRVYLRLTTKATGSSQENRVFNYPGSSPAAIYAAFNTATVSGVGYLRAACEFLSSRYSAGEYSHGRVYGYIIGCSVESAYKYYNLGEASLAEFISAYGSALRIAYNAVRLTAGAGPEVYMALGSAWDTDLTADSRYTYDSRSVIDALAAMFGEEGDIGWQPAFDPYPQEEGYAAYLDKFAGTDYSADRITLANIDLLCSYFMRQRLYYGGSSRGILLCERPGTLAPAYTDTAAATADYIYASYKLAGVNYSVITGFIISHAESVDGGVYRLIDTQRSLEVTEPYKHAMGIAEWRELIPAFDESSAIKRHIADIGLTSAPSGETAGEYALWNFDNGAAGWVGTLDCDTISGGNSFNGRDGLLRLKLSPQTADGAGVYTELEYKYDLSVAPELGFELQLAALPDGVDKAELTLILTDGINAAYASGTVGAGKWNQIYADFTGFTGIRACTRLMITLRGAETSADGAVLHENIGEPVVMLGPIKAYSAQYSNETLNKLFEDARDAALSQNTRRIDARLVWITLCVILAALSLWTVYIMARLRGRRG